MSKVVHLQFGPAPRLPLQPAPEIRLVEDIGVEGDRKARAGSKRQVLLMTEENCEAFGLKPGMVRENITTRGIDLQSLPPGTRVEVGGAVIEITQDCEPCAFIDSLRPGLQPEIEGRRGMLARVTRSGIVRVGDDVRVSGPAIDVD